MVKASTSWQRFEGRVSAHLDGGELKTSPRSKGLPKGSFKGIHKGSLRGFKGCKGFKGYHPPCTLKQG